MISVSDSKAVAIRRPFIKKIVDFSGVFFCPVPIDIIINFARKETELANASDQLRHYDEFHKRRKIKNTLCQAIHKFFLELIPKILFK